jgi:hypothetical protein
MRGRDEVKLAGHFPITCCLRFANAGHDFGSDAQSILSGSDCVLDPFANHAAARDPMHGASERLIK